MLRILLPSYFLRRLAALLPVIVGLHLACPLLAAETPQDSVPCPTCQGTATCTAKGCKDGQTPCPATCIKRDSPGWHKRKNNGFPEDYLWLEFKLTDGTGRSMFISDRHMGELVEYEEGRPVVRGTCPTCQATSRVPCATCKGTKNCTVCTGAGALRPRQRRSSPSPTLKAVRSKPSSAPAKPTPSPSCVSQISASSTSPSPNSPPNPSS